jgi:hypothetical protein
MRLLSQLLFEPVYCSQMCALGETQLQCKPHGGYNQHENFAIDMHSACTLQATRRVTSFESMAGVTQAATVEMGNTLCTHKRQLSQPISFEWHNNITNIFPQRGLSRAYCSRSDPTLPLTKAQLKQCLATHNHKL